jgi:hypothetical protein
MSNFLIITGLILILLGFILKLKPLENLPLLPGDIFIKKENFVFYFPITTSILLSILITIIIWFFSKR